MAEPQKATFGAGCFWHVQEAFDQLEGVLETEVGFMGGDVEEPSYKEVCRGDTGHAEVVHLRYDPDEITYGELLEVFWEIHDPTQLNRQGPDVGEQYRSVIFYHTPAQKEAAKQSKEDLNESGEHEDNIVTEISEAGPFYRAEEYHQKYYEKGIAHKCLVSVRDLI